MKLLVAIKHTVDHNWKPGVDPTSGQVDLGQARRAINPFDEVAIEEAVRLKEKGVVSEIIAVSIGRSDAKESLRHAYAMGADRALLIETENDLQPLAVAKVLTALVHRETPSLILLGKQGVGEDQGQTASMLAALLGIGAATFASGITVTGDAVDVTREIEKGTQRLRLKLPAAISVDLRLNEPRFIKLPNLMMAKKKLIETIPVQELPVDTAPRVRKIKSVEPKQKPGAIQMASVQELVNRLRQLEVLP